MTSVAQQARTLSLIKHGLSGKGASRAYESWKHMRQRCRNERCKDFKFYGGRGIGICARWSEFANFLSDMGERPQGYTLERDDNDGNYESTNCRWATPQEQVKNKRGNFEKGHPANSGENHGLSKLTQTQVDEIRSLNGSITQRVIASRFGVAPSNISMICAGVTWRREGESLDIPE